MQYRYITETFLDNRHYTIHTESIRQSSQNGTNVCLKCTKIRLAAGISWGSLSAARDPLAAICRPISKDTEGREGRFLR